MLPPTMSLRRYSAYRSGAVSETPGKPITTCTCSSGLECM